MGYFKKKILIISPVHPTLISKLKKKKYQFKYFPKISNGKLESESTDAFIIVLRSGVKLTSKIINKSNKLKYILRAGSGLDNIDLIAAKKRNIKVFNLPSLNSQSVAEFGIGLMLAASRNISKADNEIRRNLWNKNELYGYELNKKTLGIVGMGNIGGKIAKIAKAFSMKIIANVKNRKKKRAVSVKLVSLNHLFKVSDFISFNVPLNNLTKNLLNKKNCKLLKPNSVIINLSRGGVVDEKVLYSLLKNKKIFAAATDVFKTEGKKNKLFSLRNTVLTPHIGAMTYDAQNLIAEKAFYKISKLLK